MCIKALDCFAAPHMDVPVPRAHGCARAAARNDEEWGLSRASIIKPWAFLCELCVFCGPFAFPEHLHHQAPIVTPTIRDNTPFLLPDDRTASFRRGRLH